MLFSAVLTSSPGVPLQGRLDRVQRRRRADARPAAVGQRANVTINLLKPGEMFSDRVNELDLRVREAPAGWAAPG